MEYWSKPRFYQPLDGRKHLPNNYDGYYREQEQRILQVQAQQRGHLEAVSQRADRFLSAQRASSDAVKTRLGLSHGPSNSRVVPHPPILCGRPRFSEKFNRTDKKVDWSDGFGLKPSVSGTPLSGLSSRNYSVLPPLPAQRESPWCSEKFIQRNTKADSRYVSNYSPSVSISPLSSLSSVDTHTPDELRSVYPITPEPPFPLRESPQFSDKFTQKNRSRYSSSSSVSISPLSSLSSVDTHTPDELRSVYPITPEPPFPLRESPQFLDKSTQTNWRESPQFLDKSTQTNWSRYSISSSVSISPLSSLSSVDTHTPDELRSVYPFTPSPELTPPPVCPKKSRLPVLQKRLESQSSQMNASKVKGDPRRPCSQESWFKPELMGRALQPGEGDWLGECKAESVSEIPVQAPALAPRPPAATPIRKCSSKTVRLAQKAKEKRVQVEQDNDYRPLPNPGNSLTLALELLESKDWMKKVDAIKTIQSLARYHKSALLPKLREICLVLIQEVKSIRSCVACAAIAAMTDLFIYLGAHMDPEVEQTCRSLLLRLAQSSDTFIQERVEGALDALVENCSPRRVAVELLYTGTSHRCVAVRASAAEHLKQVLDIVGANDILSSAKAFIERFLIGVAKMAVDAGPNVRCFGIEILMSIVKENNFHKLWVKHVPDRDRRPLDKFFKKLNLH